MLKKTKVFIPVDVNDRLPEKSGKYILLYDGGKLLMKYEAGGTLFEDSEGETWHFNDFNYWLEETEGYFLTESELRRFISDVWDGRDKVRETEPGDYDYRIFQSKEEYINSLLPNK